MKFGFALLMLGASIILIGSCKSKVTADDNQGNSVEFEITEVEWTSNEKEAAKDSLIIRNITSFLRENNSAVVRNYWFLCDSSNIEPLRDYNPKHKDNNIVIHIGKENVSIRPIPGSYKIEEGPFAQYKITNDSLGRFHSYVIDVSLNDKFDVLEFHATLRFSREMNGENRVSFKRVVKEDEQYLIEEKKKTNNWW